MEKNQSKLLQALAKQIKSETKDKNAVVHTLQSAKIINKSGEFTPTYSTIKKYSILDK